jgi:ATP-dependent DNA helicase PIF1
MKSGKKEESIKLNPEQAEGLALVRAGQNVFLTGPAGTGKSVLLRELRKAYPGIAVTGSTGISALNVEGCTLHSWAGFTINEKETAAMVAKKHMDRKNSIWHSIKYSERLAIDEISMIDSDLLDKLDDMLKIVRKSEKPFGGIQLILFGDVLQLPPVGKNGRAVKFAFEARSWIEADIHVHVLTQVMRQADKDFARVLSLARLGEHGEEVRALLRPRINAVDTNPEIVPVELASHNEIADKINNDRLAALEGEEFEWQATDTGNSEMHLQTLDRNCICPKVLMLKVGAAVMLLKNIEVESGLANGSLGVLVEVRKCAFGERRPVVKFANGITRELERQEWQTMRGETVLASRTQYPLRLAYALSIHKSQGLTLAKIRVHLKRCFADGQAYVAMSRAKTLDGLFIADIDGARPFRANPVALEFYRRHSVETTKEKVA